MLEDAREFDIRLRFDYDAFDLDTRRALRERAEQIRGLARTTASSIVEIGKHLTNAKEQLKHGRFLKWIAAEFGWKERTAEIFMAVYARFKSANFAGLQIDVSALYLIAAPSTPEPVRAEALRRAENGEHVSHHEIRILLQRSKRNGEMPEVAVAPQTTIVLHRPQTQRLPNKRYQEKDRAELERVMKLVGQLEGLAANLKDLNLETAARADGFDLAWVIRSIHKSRELIGEWEQALRLIPQGGPAQKAADQS